MVEIKTQLDADHCPNMAALLDEFHKAKAMLTQKHSFRSIGAFEANAYDLEGSIIFETMMLTRAIDLVARLSIDPRAEIRRGTIAVFSELQSAYTSQRTIHELYFHQHDDKKILEERVCGAMSDMGERLTRVAVNPTGGVTQKRHNIAVELQSIAALVEEMLTMAKQSYSAALTASPYGSPCVRTHTDYCTAEATNRHPAERNQFLDDAIFEGLNCCHDPCERYELKIDYVAMDQVCTWSHYQVDILLYD
jgi:hypothetical protein